MRYLVWLPLLAGIASGSSSAQQPRPGAVPVTIWIAQAKPVSKTKDCVGRIDAVERVEVRARVAGYLEGILFKEGSIVKAGQPLYRIEQDLFKAAVEEAQGTVEGSKASKKLTEVELEHANQLLASNYGTLQKRDQALAADDNAAANILTAQANLETAKINLGYTNIPIDSAMKVAEQIIAEGIQGVRPGAPVLASPMLAEARG